MRRGIRVCQTIVIAALLGGGTACDRQPEPPHLPAVEELLASSATARIGAEDGPGWISRVSAARLTPDGERVVVLDGKADPFMKVFRHDGSLEVEAIRRGRGPSEMASVASLAVSDRQAVVVASGTMSIVALAGEMALKSPPPVNLMDAGFDCGGRFVGYGPDTASPPRYVHAVLADSRVSVQASVFEEPVPRRVGWGRGRPAIVGGPDGSVVSHRVDGGVRLGFFGCDGEIRDRAWSWAVPTFPSQSGEAAGLERVDEGVEVATIDITVPSFGGAGELPDGRLLWVERRLIPRPGPWGSFDARTYLYQVDGTGLAGGYVDGHFTLQDIGTRHLLLSTSEPWPQVLLVPVADLTRALGQETALLGHAR